MVNKDKNVLIITRLFVGILIVFEIFVALGYSPFLGGGTITWYWIAYNLFAYLIFYELPLFIFRNKTQQRQFFLPAGWFIIPLMLFDVIGNLFDLFNRTKFYDDLLHFTTVPWAFTAIMTGYAVWLCHRSQVKDKAIILSMMITFSISLCVLHEIIEYLIDVLSGTATATVAQDIYDTARDLTQDFVGIFLFFILRLYRISAYRFIHFEEDL